MAVLWELRALLRGVREVVGSQGVLPKLRVPSAEERLKTALAELQEAHREQVGGRLGSAPALLWSYRGFASRALGSRRLCGHLGEVWRFALLARRAAALGEAAGSADAEGGDEALREAGAVLASLLLSLRGVWPKAAQILSARSDVLRWPQIREALRASHDSCLPFDAEEVAAVMEAHWPGWQSDFELGEVLGTGSVGQVHALSDRSSGERFVVKVVFQRYYAMMAEDFGLLEALGSNSGNDEVSQLLREMWLCVRESVAEIEGEFDLRREAAAARRGRQALAAAQAAVAAAVREIEFELQVRLPRMEAVEVPDFGLTQSTMVQRRADGVPLADFLSRVPGDGGRRMRTKAAHYRQILEVYGEMVLVGNFFHADPHPGQWMMDEAAGRLWLLDWGLTQELPPALHGQLCEMYDLLGALYEAAPRALSALPPLLAGWLGRSAAEDLLVAALRELDQRFCERVALAMRRMGFRSRHNNSLVLTATALSIFDTAVAHADVTVTRAFQAIDPLLAWPSGILIFFRAVQTLGGLARDLREEGGGTLSTVATWRRYAGRCLESAAPPPGHL